MSIYAADVFGIGTPELIIILVIVLLLFGAKKLPELSRSLGSSIKEIRKGVSEGVSDDKSSANNQSKS
ncbi:MAG TPA: twin-arginine translocase TatA/TatE family subunit [Candidatus Saccharimonadales bacterium]|nr:twin-arginine translocase TatA/TatE family subunit [Candidatus Saccharimonadales bacterium]